MARTFFIFFLFFSPLHAWKVVDNGLDHLDQKQWKLVIAPRSKAKGVDAVMWKHIDAFLAFYKKHNLYEPATNDPYARLMACEVNIGAKFMHQELPPKFWELLSKLTFLKVLWLDNCVETIPESIGALQELERFTLNYNALKSLPKSLLSLKKLHYLNLEQNSFLEGAVTLSELRKAFGSKLII